MFDLEETGGRKKWRGLTWLLMSPSEWLLMSPSEFSGFSSVTAGLLRKQTWQLHQLTNCVIRLEEMQDETFPHHAVVYLGDSLEFRLLCISWISSRASSTLWLCLDFLPLPLLFLPATDASCKLSHESQRHASDQSFSFCVKKRAL